MSTAVVESKLEERIAQDLAPFDAVEAEIAKVREEYRDLKINGPDDKDGYMIVRKAWQHLRDIRLNAEKLHKAISEDAKIFKQACDARLRQVKNGVEPMEEDFYAQWKAEDTRKEREKEEARLKAEQEAKARIEARKAVLYSLGMAWNGTAYVHSLPNVGTVTEAQVTGLNDEPFAEMVAHLGGYVSAAKEVAAKEAEARIEAQRIAKEEADKQAAIKAENDRKTKEIEAREAAMNAKVEEVRTNEIKAIGANGIEAPMRPYAIYTEEHWTEEIDRTKAKVAARLQAEETAKQQAEMERVAREEKIRAEAANTERMRLEKEAKDKAEAEQERLRQAGDKGVIENLRNCLQTTMELMESAEVSSAIAKHGLTKAQGHLSDAIAVMNGTLGDMK
jgi:hypothetical protein